jgi:hypothetical protein
MHHTSYDIQHINLSTLDREFVKMLDSITDIYLNELMNTEDTVEGLKAFLEKRKLQLQNIQLDTFARSVMKKSTYNYLKRRK